MSPIPSQALSFSQVAPSSAASTTSSTSMSLTPLSFEHLPALGAFFLVFVFVALAGVFSYALFKFCRSGGQSKTALRPFVLPKLIPTDVAASAIAAADVLFVANHRHQGFIAYTTNANGVKKSVRIRPRAPPECSQFTEISSDPASPEPYSIIAKPSVVSNTHGRVSGRSLTPQPTTKNDSQRLICCSSSKVYTAPPPPLHMAALTKSSIIRNAADMNANPKLFPVQGPLKPLETRLPTTSLNIKRKISLLSLPAVPSPVLGSADASKKHSSVASSIARTPKQPRAAYAVPSSIANFKVSIVRNVDGMNANPKLFPVQGPVKPLDVRCTNAKVPANALMASSLADMNNVHYTTTRLATKTSTVADTKTSGFARFESNVKLAPAPGPTKSFYVYQPSQQASFGPQSAASSRTKSRAWIAFRGKENSPLDASTFPC